MAGEEAGPQAAIVEPAQLAEPVEVSSPPIMAPAASSGSEAPALAEPAPAVEGEEHAGQQEK